MSEPEYRRYIQFPPKYRQWMHTTHGGEITESITGDLIVIAGIPDTIFPETWDKIPPHVKEPYIHEKNWMSGGMFAELIKIWEQQRANSPESRTFARANSESADDKRASNEFFDMLGPLFSQLIFLIEEKDLERTLLELQQNSGGQDDPNTVVFFVLNDNGVGNKSTLEKMIDNYKLAKFKRSDNRKNIMKQVNETFQRDLIYQDDPFDLSEEEHNAVIEQQRRMYERYVREQFKNTPYEEQAGKIKRRKKTKKRKKSKKPKTPHKKNRRKMTRSKQKQKRNRK